ncbi:MAG: ATP-dependent DNA helicase RecG [Defluviitaleaceae bacterium]|nr:ATP-dependent DNA helicase RecG [Defluviitaleaceae bacterium]
MDITNLSGIGEKRALALRDAGLHTVYDLLNFFPRDYDDRSQIRTVDSLIPGAVNTIRGYLYSPPENTVPSSKRRPGARLLTLTKVILKDNTGSLELVWFNQPYLKKYFRLGTEYVFTGKVRLDHRNRLQMEAPDYEVVTAQPLSAGRIVPVYSPPKGFSQKTFRALIFQALKICTDIMENLPESIRQTHKLCNRKEAIANIHFPADDRSFMISRRRLVFEELFFMQMALFSLKGQGAAQPGIKLEGNYLDFLASLPFNLTNAQHHVLEDIKSDIQSSTRMNRLIQGDVGSGKTAAAMAAAYLTIKNGYQAAIMAPTEVLARQHYVDFSRYLDTVLLTGSQTAKERKVVLAQIAENPNLMIVGTHALIQPGVEYAKLGLVITDEQHRFGVNQRFELTEKGIVPHILVMTATPIPRTLALILYGDLDISIIDELPPGRKPIKTYHVDSRYRERIHGFIKKEAEAGRQAYVICPAIEESETDMKSVLAYTGELAATLPGLTVECLHGKMKPDEKQEIMTRFKSGEIHALVSTTVIEVGVHAPNANLMIIENAERFGLSQLHQLRGRVGRGDTQAHCVLISDAGNQITRARMKAMTETSDGFRLAELDLEQRGMGDFFGTRQHGLPDFKIANLYQDMDILKIAQSASQGVLRGEIALSDEEKELIENQTSTVVVL